MHLYSACKIEQCVFTFYFSYSSWLLVSIIYFSVIELNYNYIILIIGFVGSVPRLKLTINDVRKEIDVNVDSNESYSCHGPKCQIKNYKKPVYNTQH